MKPSAAAPIAVGASIHDSSHIGAELVYFPAEARLQLQIIAKEPLRITLVSGDRAILARFGASKPRGFSTRYVGDDFEVPREDLANLAAMNSVDFHWGCSIEIAKAQRTELTFERGARENSEKERAILRVSYEHRRLFGLRRSVFAHPLRVDLRNKVTA